MDEKQEIEYVTEGYASLLAGHDKFPRAQHICHKC